MNEQIWDAVAATDFAAAERDKPLPVGLLAWEWGNAEAVNILDEAVKAGERVMVTNINGEDSIMEHSDR